MSDPYDRTKAPKAPKAPVTFSPLRPLRTALWSWLSLGLWSTDYGPPAALPIVISLLAAAATVALFLMSEALRAFLRSAMHLDDAESREVWERRLTR